jgi:hypothetical protein
MLAAVANGNVNTSGIQQIPGMLQFRAEKTLLPGAIAITNDTNKFGVGPVIKQPYNAAFSDMRMTFLADSDGIIEYFFNFWQNQCYNFSGGDTASFLANYRSDFVAPVITVNKYNNQGALVNYFEIYKAWPTTVTPVQLDWEQQDSLVKVDVTLNYIGFTMFTQ